jgi:hypothetical protein
VKKGDCFTCRQNYGKDYWQKHKRSPELIFSSFPLVTRKVAKEQGLARFYTGIPCKNGHDSERSAATGNCFACVQENRQLHKQFKRASDRKYYLANRDRIKAQQKKYEKANRARINERSRRWYAANLDTARETNRRSRRKNYEREKEKNKRWIKAHPEVSRAQTKKWQRNNPDRVRAMRARTQVTRLNATPPWLTKEQHEQMRYFYIESGLKTSETGITHHVDHIVPIKAMNANNEHIACGLHVPWNLQVLSADDNLRKSNKLPDEFLELQWFIAPARTIPPAANDNVECLRGAA